MVRCKNSRVSESGRNCAVVPNNLSTLLYIPYGMRVDISARSVIVSGLIMIALDVSYLYFLGGSPFARMVESIQGSKFRLNIRGAVVSYSLMLCSLHYFVLSRARNKVSGVSVVRDAAVMGLVIYGVFDSTNMALFSKYKLGMAVADTLWGVFLMSVTASLTHAIS